MKTTYVIGGIIAIALLLNRKSIPEIVVDNVKGKLDELKDEVNPPNRQEVDDEGGSVVIIENEGPRQLPPAQPEPTVPEIPPQPTESAPTNPEPPPLKGGDVEIDDGAAEDMTPAPEVFPRDEARVEVEQEKKQAKKKPAKKKTDTQKKQAALELAKQGKPVVIPYGSDLWGEAALSQYNKATVNQEKEEKLLSAAEDKRSFFRTKKNSIDASANGEAEREAMSTDMLGMSYEDVETKLIALEKEVEERSAKVESYKRSRGVLRSELEANGFSVLGDPVRR